MTDSERLDWLDAEDYEGPPRIDIVMNIWWRDGLSVRAAIDAAMREEG